MKFYKANVKSNAYKLACIFPTLIVVLLSAPAIMSAQGKIVFQSGGGGNCEIYLINPDGTSEVRLTFNSAQDIAFW